MRLRKLVAPILLASMLFSITGLSITSRVCTMRTNKQAECPASQAAQHTAMQCNTPACCQTHVTFYQLTTESKSIAKPASLAQRFLQKILFSHDFPTAAGQFAACQYSLDYPTAAVLKLQLQSTTILRI